MKVFTYDTEIVEAILNGRDAEQFEEEYPGIVYVQSFKDTDKMHVSCACALISGERLPRIYGQSNLKQMQDDINAADVIVSFNGDGFDSKVLKTNGVVVPTGKEP